MRQFMLLDAGNYVIQFMRTHFWALLQMLLVFMALAIAVGLIVTGSSLLFLGALSNNLWLTVALQSPLLALVGFVMYGIWNVSFITYVLALERIGVATVAEHLKKSVSLRVLKIMVFDLLVVLFLGMVALTLGGGALISWWYGGMQIALWLQVLLGVLGGSMLIGCIYLMIRLFFTKIVIADTNTDMFTALSVSWSATDGFFWRLMGMLVAVSLVSGVVSGLAAQVTLLLSHILPTFSLGMLLGTMLQVGVALVTIVATPLMILYYYRELKVAKSLIAGR